MQLSKLLFPKESKSFTMKACSDYIKGHILFKMLFILFVNNSQTSDEMQQQKPGKEGSDESIEITAKDSG